jgi:hypothetical protein
VALIDDRAEVPLRDTMKILDKSNFVERTPSGYRQPAARCERPPHLPRRRWFVRKELESLLTDDNVELFAVVKG